MKKKYWRVILIIVILILALLPILYYFYQDILVFYFKLSGKGKETCSMVKSYFSNYSSISNKFNACNFMSIKYNMTTGSNLSCDDEKIKNDLENPASLNVDEVKIYNNLAMTEALIFEADYLNQVLNNCDLETSFSTVFFQASFTTGATLASTTQWSYIGICLDDNFTEYEKKECLTSLLNAEKSSLDSYTRLITDINITSCSDSILSMVKEQAKANPLLISPISSNSAVTICQKINYYREDMRDKVIVSDLNYLEKYAMLSTLFMQDKVFGKRDPDKQSNKLLIDNMNDTRYKNVFKEFFIKYNMI